jgi:hypothetical protein
MRNRGIGGFHLGCCGSILMRLLISFFFMCLLKLRKRR